MISSYSSQCNVLNFSLFVHIIEMNQVYLIIAVVNGKKHFGDQKPEKRRFAAISETVRLH